MQWHQYINVSWHGVFFRRKRYSEKTDGERELEDLRSRLLSKRSKQETERNIEEHQMTQRK